MTFFTKGICHNYMYERGRTGGFQDMYCSHLFKVLITYLDTFENCDISQQNLIVLTVKILYVYMQDFFFQISTKLQACQESVSDPSDLIHTMKVGKKV